MNKKFLLLSILSLSLALFVSCSDDDDNYNADTAISSYTPTDKTKLSGIKMKINDAGRDLTWSYKFIYDAKDRIKQMNLQFTTYTTRNNRTYEVNVKSDAYYRFLSDNGFSVTYTVENVFPQYPAWNSSDNGSYNGMFNSDGFLKKFGPFDCEYTGYSLNKAYLDNGREYTLLYNSYGNVTGYVCDSIDKKTEMRDIYDYEYMPEYVNNTNFDFSAFVGNIVVEREIPDNETWFYAPFHLGAFGMLGGVGTYLPKGEWTMNDGLPVKYIHPQGFEMQFEY